MSASSSRGSGPRLFVAMELPSALGERVREAVYPLREEALPFRWVDADAYHVTLKFLGATPAGLRPKLEEVLRRTVAAHPPLEVRLEGVGAFPSLRRPRVLWLGVEPTPRLRALKHDLERACAPLGFEPEGRAFRPHLTLARASGRGGAGRIHALERLVTGLEVRERFRATALTLMRSRLRPEGAEYSLELPLPLEAESG